MKEKLQRLLNNSYSPYFNYPVSCVIVMKDGKEFYGVNVETSSPASGICAERNAIYNAITNGYKKGDVKEIHIMSKTEDDCFPCFVCRQALNDFCDKEVSVISHTYNDRQKKLTVEDLCPYPFSEDNIKGDRV